MGVYTEISSDAHIVAMSKGFKKVAILGCGACTNESIAYSKGLPLVTRVPQDSGDIQEIPHAVSYEMERIAELLAEQGLVIETKVINAYGEEFVCSASDEGLESLREAIPSGDAILALCCPAGQMGIRRILGETIEILSLVRTTGTLYCHYEDIGEAREIVGKRCSVIPF